MWQEQFDEGGFGQVCAGLLLKLIVDLFMGPGPGLSYPLVLRMMRAALRSNSAKVR